MSSSRKPQKPGKELQLVELLPGEEVIQSLKKTWAIIVSRVICKYLPAFQCFQKLVIHHIPHKYTTEMSKRSKSCSADLFFFNPNVASEMAQILKINQDKYVPSTTVGGERVILSPVAQHGDQLYEERARNVQWAFDNGGTEFDRLQGIRPEFADWHAKVTLYKTEFELFVKPQSAGEIGTSRASINRTGKTNASKGCHTNYNDYKEFHEREVEAHICAAFMNMSSMSKIDDLPSYIMPDNSVAKMVQQKWLLELCESLIEHYVLSQTSVVGLVGQMESLDEARNPPFVCRAEGCDASYVYHSGRVSHEIERHGRNFNRIMGDKDELGYFYCRAGCGRVFSLNATRKKHERTFHNGFVVAEDTGNKGSKKEDPIFNYHSAKLTFGLLLFEFNDAIKEGDGDRVHNVYKLALLLYKTHGNTKYAYVVLLYLVQVSALLPEDEAISLKWNRFHNTNGGKGRNIPLDLRKEHQNKVLKTMWRGLGPNLSEDSATRLANALDALEGLMCTIDKDCDLDPRKNFRANKNPAESVTQIVSDLLEKDVFSLNPGRQGYPSFPNFSANLLQNLDYRDLHKWMTEHITKWSSVYEDRPM